MKIDTNYDSLYIYMNNIFHLLEVICGFLTNRSYTYYFFKQWKLKNTLQGKFMGGVFILPIILSPTQENVG